MNQASGKPGGQKRFIGSFWGGFLPAQRAGEPRFTDSVNEVHRRVFGWVLTGGIGK